MLPKGLAADAETAGPKGIDHGEEEGHSTARQAPEDEVEDAGRKSYHRCRGEFFKVFNKSISWGGGSQGCNEVKGQGYDGRCYRVV
jgi:hypothetical protein